MRGAYISYIRANGIGRYTDAVEAVNAKKKENAERRLALIQNGKHPDYINGHPKAKEKGTYVQVQRQEKEEK